VAEAAQSLSQRESEQLVGIIAAWTSAGAADRELLAEFARRLAATRGK
jgi:hypothetical protein